MSQEARCAVASFAFASLNSPSINREIFSVKSQSIVNLSQSTQRCADVFVPSLAHRTPRPKNINLDFAFSDVEHACDLAVAHLFLLAQKQRCALSLRQRLEHHQHNPLALCMFKVFFRVGSPAPEDFVDAAKEFVARLLLAQLIKREVARHAIEPEARFFRRQRVCFKTIETQETLLRDLLRDTGAPTNQAFEKATESEIVFVKDHRKFFIVA